MPAEGDNVDEESDADARERADTARELAELADGRLEGEDDDEEDDDDVDVDREAADAALIAALAAEEDDTDAAIPMTQEDIKIGLLASEKVRLLQLGSES